tara:strand:+ start:878 stop:1069 length:192 start_codon:yes stop_codon:yes gene_type:complete
VDDACSLAYFSFPAQIPDIHLKTVGCESRVIAPYSFINLIAGQHLVGVLEQKFKKLILSSSEV